MAHQTVNQSCWSGDQIRYAKQVWLDYQKTHDVSDRRGETAGIDPETSEVWLGREIADIVEDRKARNLSSPLFFVRIGYQTYYHKGGRR